MSDAARARRRLDLASALGLLVLVGCIVTLLSTHRLFARGPLAIGVQVAALALMAWARVTFGARSFHATASVTDGGLVTHGPYRYWRHPIYAAILYALTAALCSHPDVISLALYGGTCAGTAIRIASEEACLRDAFPDAYLAYSRRTRRIIPFGF